MEKLYTKKEVASYLRVSVRTIDRLIAKMDIPIYSIGRQTGTNSDMAQIRHKYGVKNSRHENGIVFIELTNIDNLIRDNPKLFSLVNAYPNPFNPITTLRYDLPEQARVILTIYDLLGRKVSQVVNTSQKAGFKSVRWDATDSFGKPVSTGVYLYQIQAGEFVQTRKMVLLK